MSNEKNQQKSNEKESAFAPITVITENEEKIKDYLFSFLTPIQKELLSEYVPTHNDETLRDKVVPKIKLYLAYNNAIPCDNYNKLQDGITLSPNAKKYADAGVIEHLTEPL